jgi:predicted transcriptional regulator
MEAHRELPPLSETQVEIMNAVWERGEATVSEVWNDLSSRRPWARNTVQTLMVRLEEKGWLRHRVEGNAFVYSAAVERRRALRQAVSRLVETAFEGSAEGLIMALLDGRGITPAEASRIRKLIEKEEIEP